MLIVDGQFLHVYGFNFTRLDTAKSRSFGIVTRESKVVSEAAKLFEADAMRQSYAPSGRRLVVSPENSRALLTDFIKGARKRLFIYDAHQDTRCQRCCRARHAACRSDHARSRSRSG